MLTHGSLFSGVGGFDLGFERAGLETCWQVEIDGYCQRQLARLFPHARRHGDVREAGRHNLEPVDVVSGGVPCQDLSIAGRRAGLVGEHSGLWREFLRVVGELRPRLVVVENVCGLLSSNGGRDFATIIQGLVECGFCVCWRVLDSRYFGVPQRRRRVFLVGSFGDGSCAEILFEREGVSGRAAASGEEGAQVAASIKGSPPSRQNRGSDPIAGEFIIGTLSAGYGSRGYGDDEFGGSLVSASLNGKTRMEEDVETFIVHENIGGIATPRDHACALRQGASHSYQFVAFDKGRGVDTGEVSGPLRVNEAVKQGMNGGKPDNSCISFPFGIRRLTPVECCRLQGFPDDWLDGSDTQKYRALGNAVTVNVAWWLGERIAQVMGKEG